MDYNDSPSSFTEIFSFHTAIITITPKILFILHFFKPVFPSKKNINPFLDVKIVHIYTSVNEKAGKRTKEQMVEGMKAIKNYRSLLSILNELVQRLPQTLILRGKKKRPKEKNTRLLGQPTNNHTETCNPGP